MRRRFMALAAALAAALGSWVLQPVRAVVPGSFCTSPQQVIGIGSSPQATIHAALFIPTYTAACPAAQGTVSYQGISDYAAFTSMLERTVPNAFWGRDLPLTSLQKTQVENDTGFPRGRLSPIEQIPAFVDGVAVAYNLSSCGSPGLRVTPASLAAIYSGVVTRWNDQLLVRDNPGLASCNLAVRVGVNDDLTAQTSVFQDYLGKGNPAFAALRQDAVSAVAPSVRAVTWPPNLAISCHGNSKDSSLNSCVSSPGAIMYGEWRVAHDYGLQVAQTQNASGAFVTPATDPSQSWPSACVAAASSSLSIPATATADWSQVSLTYPLSGYGICSLSYVLAFQRSATAFFVTTSPGQIRNVVDYFSTIVGDSVQRQLPANGYAPLPANVLAVSRAGVADIDYS